jgi:hypothetical protein
MLFRNFFAWYSNPQNVQEYKDYLNRKIRLLMTLLNQNYLEIMLLPLPRSMELLRLQLEHEDKKADMLNKMLGKEKDQNFLFGNNM